jgi:hypothetical protein
MGDIAGIFSRVALFTCMCAPLIGAHSHHRFEGCNSFLHMLHESPASSGSSPVGAAHQWCASATVHIHSFMLHLPGTSGTCHREAGQLSKV